MNNQWPEKLSCPFLKDCETIPIATSGGAGKKSGNVVFEGSYLHLHQSRARCPDTPGSP